MAANKDKVWVIDSHTGGEPTRVVIAGGPDLGRGPIAERQERFKNEFDDFRRAVVNEPRGSDVIVGALLCEPSNPECSAAVIFFNNVGYLGMCGHGTIGLIATLAYLGRLQPGPQRIETSVGVATANLNPDGSVTVINVPSYRTWPDRGRYRVGRELVFPDERMRHRPEYGKRRTAHGPGMGYSAIARIGKHHRRKRRGN